MSKLTFIRRSAFRGGLGGLALCGFIVSGCEIFGGDDSTSAASSCTTGEERCACFANQSCDSGLTCVSSICVAAGTSSGGSGNSNTSGSTGGSGNSNTPGSTGGSGNTDSTQTSGSGGSTQADTTQTSGSGGTTNTSTSVVNSPIIDAFASCDTYIESFSGRSGEWYSFADTDLNATFAVGIPGTAWADRSCGAWLTLGCNGTNCTYAGIGFELLNGSPYDLSSYSGVSVEFEGKDNVYFVVKTSNGGYFGTWLAGTTGNQTRNADFSTLAAMSNSAVLSLNTSLITEMQFTVGTSLALNGGWGVAVHGVTLY